MSSRQKENPWPNEETHFVSFSSCIRGHPLEGASNRQAYNSTKKSFSCLWTAGAFVLDVSLTLATQL